MAAEVLAHMRALLPAIPFFILDCSLREEGQNGHGLLKTRERARGAGTPAITLSLVKLAAKEVAVGRCERADAVLVVRTKLANVHLSTWPGHLARAAQLAH